LNFVAHAWVARRLVGPRDAVALGSMLPDFASMAGGRLAPIEHVELANGVSLHHAVDDVFHAAPDFIELCVEVDSRLGPLGFSWGASRACSHVGVELLLDGVLLNSEDVQTTYLDAMAALASHEAHIRMRSADADARWRAWLPRIRAHGAPLFYREPREVAIRLHRIVEQRPRLSFPSDRIDELSHELTRILPLVEARTSRLLDHVVHGAGDVLRAQSSTS
jgi:hypothetical protein